MKDSTRENLVVFFIGLIVFAGVVYVRHMIEPIELFQTSMVDLFLEDEEYGECTGVAKKDILSDGYLYLQTREKKEGEFKCNLKKYYSMDLGVMIWEGQKEKYGELIEELTNHRITYFLIGEDGVTVYEGWGEKEYRMEGNLNDFLKKKKIARILYTDCGAESCVLEGDYGVKSLPNVRDFVVLRESETAAPVDYFETELNGSIDIDRLVYAFINRPRFKSGKYE